MIICNSSSRVQCQPSSHVPHLHCPCGSTTSSKALLRAHTIILFTPLLQKWFGEQIVMAKQVSDTWKPHRKYWNKAKWFMGFVPNSQSNQSWQKMLSLIASVKLNPWYWSLKQVPNRSTLFFEGRRREDENENQRMIHGCSIFWLNNDGLWYNMNMSCLHCTLQHDLTGNSKSNYTNTILELRFTRYCSRYPVLETLKSPQKAFQAPYH